MKLKCLCLFFFLATSMVFSADLPDDTGLVPSEEYSEEPTQCHLGYEGCEQGVADCPTNCKHEYDHNLDNCKQLSGVQKIICDTNARNAYTACLASCKND